MSVNTHNQYFFQKAILLFIMCLPAAIASVTFYRPHILPTMAICGFAAGIFLLRHPMIFFWGIVFTAPITDHLAINLGPFNVRPYNLLAAGGFVWFVFKFLSRDFKNPVMQQAKKGIPWFMPILLLAAIKVLGAMNCNSDYLYIPMKFPVKFLTLASLSYLSCFIVFAFCTDKKRFESIIRYWLHLSNFIVILALIQLILSNVAGFHYVHHREVIWFGRPYSVFREPDVLGSFAAATSIMIIPLLIFKVKVVNRHYLFITLLSNLFIMIIILVRAAWLGFMVTAVLTYISFIVSRTEKKARPYLNRAILIGLLGMVSLPILMPSLASTLFARFASIGNPSEEGASAYRAMELDHMFKKTLPNGTPQSYLTFMIGHGDFSWSYWGPELAGDAYNQDSKTSTSVLVHPGYCMMLTFLFDNGIFGMLLVCLFFAMMTIRYFILLKSKLCQKDKALLMASFLPLIVILVCFQFSYDPITPFMWILTGCHVAWACICQNKLKQNKDISHVTSCH